MTQYICKLPIPLKQEQIKIGGEWQHKDIDTLYFKEPSISQLKCDFRYTRNAFKQLQNSIEDVVNRGQKQGKNNKKQDNIQEIIDDEKALEKGYAMLEMIEYADYEKYQKPLEEAFKIFLTKGSCFKTPQMESDNAFNQTNVDLLDYENFEAIFAMYFGYFLDFFILRNPHKMKGNIA